MSDSGAVDAAVSSLLLNDSLLRTLMPDGVYFQVAAQNAERFIVIDLVTQVDEYEFQDRAWEAYRYRIAAIALQSGGGNVRGAAVRIDALLKTSTLVIDGYKTMNVKRDGEYFHDVTVDPENASVRWQHRGAHYIVHAIPLVQ